MHNSLVCCSSPDLCTSSPYPYDSALVCDSAMILCTSIKQQSSGYHLAILWTAETTKQLHYALLEVKWRDNLPLHYVYVESLFDCTCTWQWQYTWRSLHKTDDDNLQGLCGQTNESCQAIESLLSPYGKIYKLCMYTLRLTRTIPGRHSIQYHHIWAPMIYL